MRKDQTAHIKDNILRNMIHRGAHNRDKRNSISKINRRVSEVRGSISKAEKQDKEKDPADRKKSEGKVKTVHIEHDKKEEKGEVADIKNKYKFNKLLKDDNSAAKEDQTIQINHFKYILDVQNPIVPKMLEIPEEAKDQNVLAKEHKKKWAHIMKKDRHECERYEQLFAI